VRDSGKPGIRNLRTNPVPALRKSRLFEKRYQKQFVTSNPSPFKRAERSTIPATKQGNGTWSASYDLSTLPSNATTWSWEGKLEDNSSHKFEVKENITLN
jgi:hypothetical protein